MATDEDNDSLFGSDGFEEAATEPSFDSCHAAPIASRSAPSIPGLFFFPDLLSRKVHDNVLLQVSECGYFALETETDTQQAPFSTNGDQDASEGQAYRRSPRNQAMLFARSLAPPSQTQQGDDSHQVMDSGFDKASAACAGLPAWAIELIQHLRQLLTSVPDSELPGNVKDLLFPADQLLSRQLILNLYNGAEGLAPHVDLVHRFADGILLCSFGPQGTGTVMDFTHASKDPHHLFLPSGSVLLLSGEARYEWKHGISARHSDLVRSSDCLHQVDQLSRSIRLSITIRSMLNGADVGGQ